jgi:putative ABC transport system substrate-binding protein
LFSFRRDTVDMGGFLSYGADMYDQFRKTGAFIDKIVNGANPGDTPVEFPTQLEFAVNLKKAAEYGIPIPRSVLLRADRVIK